MRASVAVCFAAATQHCPTIMAANFWNSTHYRNWLRKVDDIYQLSLASQKRYVRTVTRTVTHPPSLAPAFAVTLTHSIALP